MINVENVDVWGFEHAIRGMRNPLNSWAKSDSRYGVTTYWDEELEIECEYCGALIGGNDLDLMRRLYKAGPEHRKYLRQIFVSMDITAPLYWWKEFDTYKIGTTANSCSTMHKIAAKEFSTLDFSCEHLTIYGENGEIQRDFIETLNCVIDDLNAARELYLKTKDKKWWWQMIQLLPSSYNQKRTVTLNYENVISMIKQRTGHKLDEWNNFIEILKELPYIEDIMEEK